LLWVSPARTLVTTIHGRLYLATVTATHLREVPLAGYGPGSFELKFAGWQDAWLREHREDARFAGPVDHAHDDYLEFWVEYGPLGLGAFLLLCGWLLVRAGRVRPPDGTLGALAALVAIACVDFPFHRPAEWALFAMLASLTRRTD
jgi:O-antigen ligase